jgi:proteic killer suppression protein
MIKSFRHRGLKELFSAGSSPMINPNWERRCLMILDILNASARPQSMDIPGLRFHTLRGNPTRYSVRVTGNWRITFRWDDGAIEVNLEDYH